MFANVRETELQATRHEGKIGKRGNEPEKGPFNVDKLHKCMGARLHAGALPAASCRCPSVAARGQRLVAQRLKLKHREALVSAAMKEMSDQAAQ